MKVHEIFQIKKILTNLLNHFLEKEGIFATGVRDLQQRNTPRANLNNLPIRMNDKLIQPLPGYMGSFFSSRQFPTRVRKFEARSGQKIGSRMIL